MNRLIYEPQEFSNYRIFLFHCGLSFVYNQNQFTNICRYHNIMFKLKYSRFHLFPCNMERFTCKQITH